MKIINFIICILIYQPVIPFEKLLYWKDIIVASFGFTGAIIGSLVGALIAFKISTDGIKRVEIAEQTQIKNIKNLLYFEIQQNNSILEELKNHLEDTNSVSYLSTNLSDFVFKNNLPKIPLDDDTKFFMSYYRALNALKNEGMTGKTIEINEIETILKMKK